MQGIWLPLITPFANGIVDEVSLVRLVRRYLDAPIDGLILAATTGEALTLEPEETERLVSLVAASVAGKVPVFLGLCGSDTRRMALRIRVTRAWPIDGYLITAPYYTRPSQDGLRQHFTILAGQTERPVALYNIPYRTGVNMSNETLLALAEVPNIIGVKDCCAIHAQTFELLCSRPTGFLVMTGEDALFYSAIVHGADGGILASAHIDPAGFAATLRHLRSGNLPAALQTWRPIATIVELLFAEPSPAPIKHWLWREGWIASPELRLPMTPVSEALAAKIEQAIAGRQRASATAA
jgi:4-hydroxy-tetrahydrodipicolinate synthase